MIGRIRRARLDDAAAVAYVHVAGWRETYPGIVPARTLASMDVFSRTRYWAQVLDNKRNRTDIFLAEMPIDGEDRVIGFGVNGPEQVGLTDYSGEFHALSTSEATAVTRTVVAAVAGRVPVIAGAGGPLGHAIEVARAAKDAGADCALMVPPAPRRGRDEEAEEETSEPLRHIEAA